MKKARTCYGCYAHVGGFQDYCSLGCQTEVYEVKGIRISRPKACCHKPKTLHEYYIRYIEYKESKE